MLTLFLLFIFDLHKLCLSLRAYRVQVPEMVQGKGFGLKGEKDSLGQGRNQCTLLCSTDPNLTRFRA